MADKEPDTAQADPELSQLAASIVGEEVPVVTEGKDSVSPKDQPTSEGKDGEQPPASEGEEKPKGEGEEKPKDGEEKGEEEDPLKDLAADKGALKALLEHSILGPLLNSWMDRASGAKVTAALEHQKPITEAETKRAEAERVEDARFSGMTKEQISEEIAGDEQAAVAYARYQERKQSSEAPNAEAIAQSAQLYAYASEVSAVKGLLDGSELSAEVKDSLKPEHFTHLKTEGIREWKKAVFQALVTHEATGLTAKEMDEKWEAEKETRLAELDGERPAVVTGRRDGPTPDLIKTDSGVLLESALSAKPKKGK